MKGTTEAVPRVREPRMNEGRQTHATLQFANSLILFAEEHCELLLRLLCKHGHV